jgi:hypothetical protein
VADSFLAVLSASIPYLSAAVPGYTSPSGRLNTMSRVPPSSKFSQALPRCQVMHCPSLSPILTDSHHAPFFGSESQLVALNYVGSAVPRQFTADVHVRTSWHPNQVPQKANRVEYFPAARALATPAFWQYIPRRLPSESTDILEFVTWRVYLGSRSRRLALSQLFTSITFSHLASHLTCTSCISQMGTFD